jgi:hypothetical protein
MKFDLLDRYLLDASPVKAEVVKTLLSERSEAPGAAPFYEGMRMLGARTPDLTLVALRLVLAGRRADDEAVVELRALSERARTGDGAAREAYRRLLAASTGE